MLNLNPKLIKRSVKITGLTSGELNKNTLLTPSDTPLFKNPFKSGSRARTKRRNSANQKRLDKA